MYLQRGVISYLLMLLSYFYSTESLLLDNRTATVSSSWRNNPLSLRTITYKDGSIVNIIIDPPSDSPHFSLGFYSDGNLSSFFLAIFLHYPESESGFPQVVWSANRNNPVKENATLELFQYGDLVLTDVNGVVVWSSHTYEISIVRMELADTGNLMLVNSRNTAVWQSFDQPTDTLVLGQKLVENQELIATVSPWIQSNYVYSLFVSYNGLNAVIESYGVQYYYYSMILWGEQTDDSRYARLQNGSLSLYSQPESYKADKEIHFPPASPVQFMKLDSDGHLRVYDWSSKWVVVADLLNLSESAYPLVCGKYGVYSEGHCGCPQQTIEGASLFRPINSTEQSHGCREVTPLTCEASKYHSLINLTYVFRFDIFSDTLYTDLTSCMKACLSDCSCKTATFSSAPNQSNGYCGIWSDIFSFIHDKNSDNGAFFSFSDHTTFIKVQTVASAGGKSREPLPAALLVLIWASSFGILFCILLITKKYFHLRKMNVAEKHKKDVLERHANHLDFLSGIPMQFSYEDLKDATQNFSCKLGEGAFGTVYEGTLTNGTKVAVKQLDALGGHAKMSFSAEVETIGSIHHVNLVKLVGFCSDESQYILVYEYLCNGSLDKWIFCPTKDKILDWEIRRKIITHVARGIAYLHEDCSQRILHLDIKPQNILLDDKFNAKVSDFGLSKLINKDQSKVMTTIRGTPGYMAPEWLSSAITEKVDVYSFGIVAMEILCGRKNVVCSEPEEIPLLNILMENTNEDGLYDMMDSNCDDMNLHATEVLGIMKLVLWCVHSDCRRRPSMSAVVKLLDSLLDVEGNVNDNLLNSLPSPYRVGIVLCSPMLPSVLSGPR